MKKLLCILSAVAFVGAAMTAFAGGLQVGERCAAFNVNDITGSNKGKTLCYI